MSRKFVRHTLGYGFVARDLGRHLWVRLVAEHVVHAAEVALALLQGGPQGDHLADGRHEAHHKGLEGDQHTYGQVARHDPQRPDAEDGRGGQGGQHGRDAGDDLGAGAELLLRLDKLGLQSSPADEEVRLVTRRLQRLYGLQAAHGHARQFAALHQQPLVRIYPLPGDEAQGYEVQRGEEDTDQGKNHVVLEHDDHVEKDGGDVEGRGRHLPREKLGDPVVHRDPRSDLPSVALVVELQGQAQGVPEQRARHAHRELGLQPQQIVQLQPRQRGPQQSRKEHADQERTDYALRALHEVLVDKDLGEDGDDDPWYDQRQARQHDEGERPLGALQPPAHGGYQAGLTPALVEARPGLEGQHHPRVGPVELLVGGEAPAAGRIADVNSASAAPFDHEKVAEVPEHYERRLERPELVRLFLETPGDHAVVASGLHDVGGLGTVPRDAAGGAQLFQRHDLAVVAQDDPERRRPALDSLHLQDGRRLYVAPALGGALFRSGRGATGLLCGAAQ